MSKRIDIVGQVFSRLRVLSRNEELTKQRKQTYYNCVCECGNTSIVWSNHLRNGRTKSCGCYCSELTAAKNYKHGDAKTRLFRIWKGVKERCYYTHHIRYNDYGGRGIIICEEWSSFQKFKDWAMTNGYQDNLTIDRIDVNGNYEPSNCRWTTYKVQTNNTRRNNRFEYNGESKTISELAEIAGLKYRVLHDRLVRYKMDIQRAMNSPVR